MKTQTTKVIFRKFNDGEVIALLPEFTNSHNYTIVSYMHIGQHSDADYNQVVSITKLANKEEYTPLLNELKEIYKDEYPFKVMKKTKIRWAK
jgi:molybdenum cofactor biosynthesis enzyme MoaA